jgi:hypothetical protein
MSTSPEASAVEEEQPASIILVSYPKIVFMYPTLIMSLIAAIYTTFGTNVLDPTNETASLINALFVGILGVNLVVLAFDFPRTTSLTLFFLLAAIGMGLILMFTLKPDWLPVIRDIVYTYHPAANATFYWSMVAVLAIIYGFMFAQLKFDYWEVRPNELLHHHGALSNLERFSAPNMRIDKEVNDLFEYMLLQSGRLIIHPDKEPRAIILDNVPFISRKETELTRMLGALQVQVRK